MGIYTMPEKLSFPDAESVEEADTYVTIRLKGNMHASLAFGVHRIDRKLIHTLEPN